MTAHIKGQQESRSHISGLPETRTAKAYLKAQQRARLTSEMVAPITAHFSDEAIASLMDRAETPFEQVPMGDRTVTAHRGNIEVANLISEQMKRGAIAPRPRPEQIGGVSID